MKNLKELVFEALDNALEGDADFRDYDPKSVADDLVMYDDGLEDVEPKLLVEHVVAWQESRREKGHNSRESRMARGAYLGQVARKSEI